MIHLFCGHDTREALGFHVFADSIIRRASQPVSIIPLASMGMGEGSNAFTLSRFLVSRLMGYTSHAIFVDACDMLCMADIADLDALFQPHLAVQVVKHPAYKTQHRTKYRGTSMECPNLNYDRKNWTSVMIVNCEHPAWRIDIEALLPIDLLTLKFINDADIGELPPEWNRLVDEGQPIMDARILHFTAGIPCIPAHAAAPGAELWIDQLKELTTPPR